MGRGVYLRKYARNLQRMLQFFGLNLSQSARACATFPGFVRQYRQFKARSTEALPAVSLSYPILTEASDAAGTTDGQYFHQDLWAAKRIFANSPHHHVDIGSRIDGFVAHILVFTEVEVIDIRPMRSSVDGLRFTQADATTLVGIADDSVTSLSSLHAAEHFGLGRYGDPIDPEGHLRFMRALKRVLAPGGHLYFSVPVGRERVEFNAHRVLSPNTILCEFGGLDLVSFSIVKDDGVLYPNCTPEDASDQEYACGLFEFEKPTSLSPAGEKRWSTEEP